MKKILAVETSCDDTCVSLVCENGFVEESYKQDQDKIHAPFGGVVPERASRNHSRYLLPLIDQILRTKDINQISLLACTNRPGLMGSLLVGLVTVKTLSALYKKPFIGVNHIEGHILSPFIYDSDHQQIKNWDFPYIALVVSGGHTHLFLAQSLSQYVLLGQTLDDAAGEAFDKFARLLNLPYPGGVHVDQQAQSGDPHQFSFPVAMARKGSLDFSFSGLKTSAYLLLKKLNSFEKEKASLCASFQEAIVNQIIFKLNESVKQYPECRRVAVVGGVSANSRLRKRCIEWAGEKSLDMAIPPLKYCTDNAAMIGYAGIQRYLKGESSSMELNCLSTHQENDFIYPKADIS